MSELTYITAMLPSDLTDRVRQYAANGEMTFDEALTELLGDALSEGADIRRRIEETRQEIARGARPAGAKFRL